MLLIRILLFQFKKLFPSFLVRQVYSGDEFPQLLFFGESLYFSSISKEYFASILGWQVCLFVFLENFSTLYISLQSFLGCVVSIEKSTDNFMGVPL